MSEPGKAVFLSYASQDAEAAKKIADALRAAGVEVWFDTDGGLEHGDEWDAKIRRQIKECVLFIPIISAHTQEREEGYFRLEWDMAAERARTIASGVAFILPVVIDDTKEPAALVPDRFRTVQWTKLPGGVVPPEVLQRFLKLWSHRTGALKHEAGRTAPSAAEAIGKPGGKSYALAAVAIALLVAGIGWWMLRPAVSGPAPVAAVMPPPAGSETDQLVRQARELIYDPDSARNEFALAENLLKRATDLSPASGAAWGASALLNHYFYSRTYDGDRQRLVRSQAEAEKALRLDPRNTDALLALGLHRQELGDKDRAQDYLDRALAADPQNFKALLAQSRQLSDHSAKAKFLLEAADRVSRPAELLYYAAIELGWAWRFAEAKPVCERAIAAQPFWRTYVQRAVIEESLTADPAAMNRWLDKVPESKRDEPRVAFMRFSAAMLQRDGAAAVRALNSLAADYLEDSFYTGPRAFLLAQAHELAGQPGLAAEQWQLAERAVREKLAADPGGIQLRAMLAESLAGQHRPAEAKTVADACVADDRLKSNTPAIERTARAYARLGEPDRAIELLRLIPAAPVHTGGAVAANLGVSPLWDTLRDRPGYAKLLEELKRAEHRDAGEPTAAASKADDKSVAVLPFANLSGDAAQEYFSDGLTDEILTTLSTERDLRVVARTSVFAFKGKTLTTPEIARALNVAQVVEGSVRKSGNLVKITVSLTRASDGFSEPLGTFTEKLDDIFALQEKVARAVVEKLTKRTVTVEGVVVLTKNPEAYDLYLKARAERRNPAAGSRNASINQRERLLQAAVTLDPNFAAGWAELAMTQSEFYNNNVDHSTERLALMKASIDQAVRLAPEMPEVLSALGRYHLISANDYPRAAEQFEKRISLQPNNAEAYYELGVVRRRQGRWATALASFQKTSELDPGNSGTMRTGIIRLLENGRRYEEAIQWQRRLVALQPENVAERYALAYLSFKASGSTREMETFLAGSRETPGRGIWLAVQGKMAEAVRVDLQLNPDEAKRGTGSALFGALLRAASGDLPGARALLARHPADLRARLEREPGNLTVIVQLAQIEAMLGHRDEALRAAQQGIELMPESLNPWDGAKGREILAFAYAWTGDKDRAIAEYAKLLGMIVADGGEQNIFEMRHHPRYYPLQGDPRFEALLNDPANNAPLF